jgi:hypothetical protein
MTARPQGLHEFLSFLKIQQSGQEEDNNANNKYNSAFHGNDGPGCLVHAICGIEGIEKDIPLALAEKIGILHYHKKEADNYHNHRSTIAVPDYCRQHECHHTKKDHREHNLDGHIYKLKLHYQQG